MNILTVPARTDRLDEVTAFVGGELSRCGCPDAVRVQVELAVEEIFVNIASYAYPPGTGEAEVAVDAAGDPRCATIRFLDRGRPFNPLAQAEPDTTLPAAAREVGGLGILLVRRSMDAVSYSYEDGKNVLTLRKRL